MAGDNRFVGFVDDAATRLGGLIDAAAGRGPPGGMHPNVLPCAAWGCAGPDVRAEVDPRPGRRVLRHRNRSVSGYGVPPGTVRLERSPAGLVTCDRCQVRDRPA